MDLSVNCWNGKIDFMSNLTKNLYLNEKKADVFFVCGVNKERVPAHKLILAEASEIFDKMFYEKSANTSITVVTLPNTSPEVFKDFLQFFYLNEVNLRIAHIAEIIHLGEMYRIPNQRFLYELNHVPELNSPKHIFNVLNDDCIRAIFRKLPIEDYLNAANVCTRFQYNAKLAFPPEYRRLDINNYYKHHDNVLDQTIAICFLRTFGKLVQSIHCNDHIESVNNDFLNMVAEYCGKNLIEFGYNGDLDFNVRLPFKALKKLNLWAVNASNFNLYSQLTSLRLGASSQLDFMRPFSKLTEVQFCQMDLTESQLATFLQVNPQLKRLQISLNSGSNLNPLMYGHIANYGHNLEYFSTLEKGGRSEMMQLSNLPKLKVVEISYVDNVHLNRLIEKFIQNNVAIEELNVRMTRVTDTQAIKKLKNLKKLVIGSIVERSIVDIVENLPQIEKVEIVSKGITAKGIIDCLKAGKQLNELKIAVSKVTLTLTDYNTILALAINCTRVEIVEISSQIPGHVLKSNSKWLKICSLR